MLLDRQNSKLFLCKCNYIYGLKITLLKKYVKVTWLIFYNRLYYYFVNNSVEKICQGDHNYDDFSKHLFLI